MIIPYYELNLQMFRLAGRNCWMPLINATGRNMKRKRPVRFDTDMSAFIWNVSQDSLANGRLARCENNNDCSRFFDFIGLA